MLYPPKIFLMICLVVFLSGCLVGQHGPSGRVVVQNDQAKVDISFSDDDRDLLREHYGYKHQSKYKKIPPGLAKKNKLPPGIKKQLVRNGQLPSGLYYRSLPSELERRMSRIPEDYIRVVIDESFVLFDKNTRVIFDIIHDL